MPFESKALVPFDGALSQQTATAIEELYIAESATIENLSIRASYNMCILRFKLENAAIETSSSRESER